MELTHEELKNRMADHYEWVEARIALHEAEAKAAAELEASLLDRFERDWGEYEV